MQPKVFGALKKFVKKQTTVFAIICLPPRVKSTRNHLKITLHICAEERNSPVGVFLTYFFCGKAKECKVPAALGRVMPERANPLTGNNRALNETSYINLIIAQRCVLCLLLAIRLFT